MQIRLEEKSKASRLLRKRYPLQNSFEIKQNSEAHQGQHVQLQVHAVFIRKSTQYEHLFQDTQRKHFANQP